MKALLFEYSAPHVLQFKSLDFIGFLQTLQYLILIRFLTKKLNISRKNSYD